MGLNYWLQKLLLIFDYKVKNNWFYSNALLRSDTSLIPRPV